MSTKAEQPLPQAKETMADDLRPEWSILVPSILVIVLISLPSILMPASTESFFKAIYDPLAANFGTLYLWITVGLIVLCFYFALSRYGNIKFGDRNEKPEFSIMSWTAMIFCSAVGGAIMFWAITEPLWDILSPPQYVETMSVGAYDWALAYLLMHWGPNAWCTYLMTSLPIAYLLYIRKVPLLRVSMATAPLIGEDRARGTFGRCLDVFFILGLMFCTAVTMCISLPTVAFALQNVFGVNPSLTTQIVVLLFSGPDAAVHLLSEPEFSRGLYRCLKDSGIDRMPYVVSDAAYKAAVEEFRIRAKAGTLPEALKITKYDLSQSGSEEKTFDSEQAVIGLFGTENVEIIEEGDR